LCFAGDARAFSFFWTYGDMEPVAYFGLSALVAGRWRFALLPNLGRIVFDLKGLLIGIAITQLDLKETGR
jgi:hypothetical protein